MTTLARPIPFTASSAAMISTYADEIERVATATLGNTSNASRPRFRIYLTSGSIANNTETVITWQAALSDPRGMWSAGTPTQLLIKDPGDWLLMAQTRWPASATGSRAARILKNGTTPSTNAIAATKMPGQSDAEGTTVHVATIDRFALNDLIYLNCWHTAGSSQNLQTNYGGTFFSGVWLGP